MMNIKLNCDLGESFGIYTMGLDADRDAHPSILYPQLIEKAKSGECTAGVFF